MWFVWDGKARQGPLEQEEICRRLATGQLSLFVKVRPEESCVYRPVSWVLSQWYQSVKKRLNESQIRSSSLPKIDETRWASNESSADSELTIDTESTIDIGATIEIRRDLEPEISLHKKTQSRWSSGLSDDQESYLIKDSEPERISHRDSEPIRAFDPDHFEHNESQKGRGVTQYSERTPVSEMTLVAEPLLEIEKTLASNDPSQEERLPSTQAMAWQADDPVQGPKKEKIVDKTVSDDFLERDFLQDIIEEKVHKIKSELKLDLEPPPTQVVRQVQPTQMADKLPQRPAQPQIPAQRSQITEETASYTKRTNPIATGNAPEFPPQLQTKATIKSDAESVPKQSRFAKKTRSGNQKPAMASEGSVNLATEETQTQIKIRRVNPTAPRKNSAASSSQSPFLMIFSKKWWKNLDPLSLVAILTSAVATLLVFSFLFFESSQRPSKDSPANQNGENSRNDEGGTKSGLSRSSAKQKELKRKKYSNPKDFSDESKNSRPVLKEKSTSNSSALVAAKPPPIIVPRPPAIAAQQPSRPENKSRGDQKTKKMAARRPLENSSHKKMQAISSDGVTKNQKANVLVLSSGVQIDNYLSSTSPSSRKFVVIGPVSVVDRPPPYCGPCQGKGVLPDGSIVNLNSVMFEPWLSVGKMRTLYVKGFVVRTTSYSVTVNALSHKPLR